MITYTISLNICHKVGLIIYVYFVWLEFHILVSNLFQELQTYIQGLATKIFRGSCQVSCNYIICNSV